MSFGSALVESNSIIPPSTIFQAVRLKLIRCALELNER